MPEYEFVISDLPIYKAALHDDWDSVSQIFEQDPKVMTKQINRMGETPLIIAVGTNCSHRFVQKLMERIVAVGDADKLWVTSFGGENPLHYAAKVGNTTDARLLVDQNLDMTLVPNRFGRTALNMAAWSGKKEMLKYLLTVVHDSFSGEEGTSPFTGVNGGDLITSTITAGFYDVALEIIEMHPNIVVEYDRYAKTALQILAMKPEIFASGSRFGFWSSLIYSKIPVEMSPGATQVNFLSRFINKFTTGFWSALRHMSSTIRNIHDVKVNNIQSSLLVNRICKIVIQKDLRDIWKILGSSIATAVTNGIHELIEECILTYPGLVWYEFEGFNLFQAAIKHRQERVYNLVHQMCGHKVLAAAHLDGDHNNALHLAARLAPSHRLDVVPGAALQMQRELQWFEEVGNFVLPFYRDALNKRYETPKMIFTEEHKELLIEGQQWMKDTASSCTLVAALIVTMAFAVAFAVPGGNQDNDGKPHFLNEGAFMVFMVADAVAFFSSSTSVLMFLGILTRYTEDDFLSALPNRMTIGFLSLFLSIAATMIAFSATFTLILEDKVAWIVAPLVIATSIPLCLFGLLQFPLLVQLVNSSYGPSIFRKQSNRRIY